MAYNFLEWLSSNAEVRYPFKEDSSLQDDAASITIPEDLFIDFVASGALSDSRYFVGEIRSISGPPTNYEIDIINQNSDLIATIAVTPNPSLVRTVGTVTGFEGGRDIPIKWVWGPAIATATIPFNTVPYFFTSEQAEFEPSTIAPAPNTVLSFSVFDPDETLPVDPLSVPAGDRLEGAVNIEEGFNTRVTVDESQNSVIISSARGLGAGAVVECPPFPEIDPKPIVFINGITPTDLIQESIFDGNFRVVGDDCIQVKLYPNLHMIGIHNRCRPCCDCNELDDIIEKLEEMEALVGIVNPRLEHIEVSDRFTAYPNLTEIAFSATANEVEVSDSIEAVRAIGLTDNIEISDTIHTDPAAVNFFDQVEFTENFEARLFVEEFDESIEVSDVIDVSLKVQNLFNTVNVTSNATAVLLRGSDGACFTEFFS